MAGRAIFIGCVVRKNSLWKAARIRVQKMKLDEYLGMYFNKKVHYWATDPDEKLKLGDMVLIQALAQPVSDRVKYEVRQVEFPLGVIHDPVTGKRCRGDIFMEDYERKFQDLNAIGDLDLKVEHDKETTSGKRS